MTISATFRCTGVKQEELQYDEIKFSMDEGPPRLQERSGDPRGVLTLLHKDLKTKPRFEVGKYYLLTIEETA